MITKDLQNKILSALQQQRENFTGSDAKYSISIGINAAQYSRIKNGDTDKVLSDGQWITLARKLGVNPNSADEWKTANTPIFQYITTQLELCQRESQTGLLCDRAGIGKTYTAKYYARTHKSVCYIDCSAVKTKQRLIRHIAKEFGVGSVGRFDDVYDNLVFFIKSLPTPLIILDEAGDLSYEAFLELKAFMNKIEFACGWYMMGADGLKEKIRRSIECKKVGYTEIFSRFGDRYGKVIPFDTKECERILQASAVMIIKANSETADINTLLRKSVGDDNMPSLRRIYREIAKERMTV